MSTDTAETRTTRARTAVVDAFGVTDRGKVRDANEDQFLVASLSKNMIVEQTSLPQNDHERLVGAPRCSLLAVADGMGGHGNGDVASTLAVDVMTQYVLDIMPWFLRLDRGHETEVTDELRAALERCNTAVRRTAETDDSTDPRMGTTLTMAYILWPHLYVVHVGDSRCYLFRGSELQQITKDHTLAQQMVDEKVLDQERASASRWSNVLWNSLGGGSDEMEPDVYRAELELGDTLLLCTDGLTKHVDERGLSEILQRSEIGVETLATALVDAANRGGGSDNVTAVVARFH